MVVSPNASGQVLNESAKLLPSDGVEFNEFGSSVAVAGDVTVVGAVGSSSAYVFRWCGSTWLEDHKLLASDGGASDDFGISVSVSGETAVVGARFDDDNGSDSDSAYVFSIPPSIPTLSEWGLVAMTLFFLVSGMLDLKGRRQTHRMVA